METAAVVREGQCLTSDASLAEISYFTQARQTITHILLSFLLFLLFLYFPVFGNVLKDYRGAV